MEQGLQQGNAWKLPVLSIRLVSPQSIGFMGVANCGAQGSCSLQIDTLCTACTVHTTNDRRSWCMMLEGPEISTSSVARQAGYYLLSIKPDISLNFGLTSFVFSTEHIRLNLPECRGAKRQRLECQWQVHEPPRVEPFSSGLIASASVTFNAYTFPSRLECGRDCPTEMQGCSSYHGGRCPSCSKTHGSVR